MAAGLRQLTRREVEIVGKYAARHGQVRGLEQSIADNTGAISAPLLRLPLLHQLERRGVITSQEAGAGDHFNSLFQHAALDGLRAADMGRIPMPPGTGRPGEISSSAESCRRRVSEALVALGGAASAPAGAVWHCCGLEWSVLRWARTTQRRQETASGILIAGLAVLAAHFAGGRR